MSSTHKGGWFRVWAGPHRTGATFGQLGLHTIWGARGPENEASAALMRRLGFVDAEIFRNHIAKNGMPRDSIAAKVNRDDWHAVLAAEHRVS